MYKPTIPASLANLNLPNVHVGEQQIFGPAKLLALVLLGLAVFAALYFTIGVVALSLFAIGKLIVSLFLVIWSFVVAVVVFVFGLICSLLGLLFNHTLLALFLAIAAIVVVKHEISIS